MRTNRELFESLISRSYLLEQFAKQYKIICSGKTENARNLYYFVLTKLKQTIVTDTNIDKCRKYCRLINYIHNIEDLSTFASYKDDLDYPFKNTNLIILACEHNQLDILKFILEENNAIINNLFTTTTRTNVCPYEKDDKSHNAFYYAIRSNNVQLIDSLIKKWPSCGGNYFVDNNDKLDGILSEAYEQLKLQNVLLSDGMEFFVQDRLINLRFFSDNSEKDYSENDDDYRKRVNERIQLVLENAATLIKEYAGENEIDEKFLFLVKCIAQNIHILKRQLKFTYAKLPWEEVEFCLVAYISACTTNSTINLFYHFILNKCKLLNYLDEFSKNLKNQRNIINKTNTKKFAILPQGNHQLMVEKIIKDCPEFEELYNDYRQIRDIHSLQKISDYVKLALSIDAQDEDERIIIIRILQLIGEYLKNTLESPKLSDITIQLFLLSLPNNTRTIIINLRNSFSHAYALHQRMNIEENADSEFYTGVQNDIETIGNVIDDILANYRTKIMKRILKNICSSENLEDVKKAVKVGRFVDCEDMLKTRNIRPPRKNLCTLVNELNSKITDQTEYEKSLFKKIDHVINYRLGTNLVYDTKCEMFSLALLLYSNYINLDNFSDDNTIRTMKLCANNQLKNDKTKFSNDHHEEIVDLLLKIFSAITSRTVYKDNDEMNRLIREIYFHIDGNETCSMKWIRAFKIKLSEECSFVCKNEGRKYFDLNAKRDCDYQQQLTLKLNKLKYIFNNLSNDHLGAICDTFENNRKLRTRLEMLILDIMSILADNYRTLENNLLFLDNGSPTLIGKCLRNHLAHDDVLTEILSPNSNTAVILNAKKFAMEDVKKIIENKIGKLADCDEIFKLKTKYNDNLLAIKYKRALFTALEAGDMENVIYYIKLGADIHARNFNLWTSLHFAVKSGNLECVKFVLANNIDITRDILGQNILHVAANYGNEVVLKFLIKQTKLSINGQDNVGKTPLHIAAQKGHLSVVRVLLKYNATTWINDDLSYWPLSYAIRNNRINVVRILLEDDVNSDTYSMTGGLTPLLLASEFGHVELVEYLLERKANVKAKNEEGYTALHAAALQGHLKIVNALIANGSDVNARVLNGCTPLHFAAENNHEEIIDILLKNGSSVNVVDKAYNKSPLHHVAESGNENIVKILLKNKANPNIATIDGMTPLHFAVQCGHLEIIRIFLEHGVDINTTYNLLHCAAFGGYSNVVKFLIENELLGTNGYEMNTSLHTAADRGHMDIVDILIQSNKCNVNARNIDGNTPLHAAATNGHTDIINYLIQNNAEINVKNNDGITPLFMTIIGGHISSVSLLIKNNANVNIKTNEGITPLFMAVQGGYRDIVEILILNGVEIDDNASMFSAVQYNRKEIIEILLSTEHSSNTNCSRNVEDSLLAVAITNGLEGAFDVLIKYKAKINIRFKDDVTMLHLAAEKGSKKIVNFLIHSGVDIDAVDIYKRTALHIAAQEDREEIAEILIANKANIDFKCGDGSTPLHLAASFGCQNVTKTLLKHNANTKLTDEKNRTALELAVCCDHFEVVKILLRYMETNKIDKVVGNTDGFTLLHIASAMGNMKIVEYLIRGRVNVHDKNIYGSKAIHIAARKGRLNIVQFFINNGLLGVNEVSAYDLTVLHCAVVNDHSEIVKYLIAQGADVNVKDENGRSPLHISAQMSSKRSVEILLTNGAVYNATDKENAEPVRFATDEEIIRILTLIRKLFDAVKCNNLADVEDCINAGVLINAKNNCGSSVLHYAVWKGYEEIVNVLLKNKADPNILNDKGSAALHYAVKFSHLNIVMALLRNGAIYNASSGNGKTPLDFVVDDKDIASVLRLINRSFENIKNNNYQIIKDLRTIRDDVGLMNVVRNARNDENRTLIVCAIRDNFGKVDELKKILRGVADLSEQIFIADVYSSVENYSEAYKILTSVFEKRKEMLGPDNPDTLEIQSRMARILYRQGYYEFSLKMFEEIFEKQCQQLGVDNNDTLNTRGSIALIYHWQDKYERAFKIFEDVCRRQVKLLGPNHLDVINNQFHMALVLDKLERYEEALDINRSVFNKRKEILGPNDPETISAENNIAMVLANQDKCDEALEIYKKVYEKKKTALGPNHSFTLRTLFNMASIFLQRENFNEAVNALREVLDMQKQALGLYHPDTMNTEFNLLNALCQQDKLIGALKICTETFDRRKAMYGANHPTVLYISAIVETINLKFKLTGGDELSEIFRFLQNKMNIAADKGDVETIDDLLKSGADVNDNDIDGRTPLHYAVNGGYVETVNLLLNNGADLTKITNKGNTILHTAVSAEGRAKNVILNVLLQRIRESSKLNYLIDAGTFVNGTTPLHVAAAKIGSVQIVKLLLKYGAIFDVKNKQNQTPLHLSSNRDVVNLLQLINELFQMANNGNIDIIEKLNVLKPDEFTAAINARNDQRNTLLQVTIIKKHKKVAPMLLRLMKNAS